MRAGLLGIVTLPLMGALVAIAGHQLALGRADRTYRLAAAWSVWSATVLLTYWLVHLVTTDADTLLASRLLYTAIAAGLPIGLLLARNLYEGHVEREVLRRWLILAILGTLSPLAVHLTFPEHWVVIDDLLAGSTRFATVGLPGGLVLVPALPVIIVIRRWLKSPQRAHNARLRAARVMVPLFIFAAINDILVLAAGLPSFLLFPFVAVVQTIVLHAMLVAETAEMYRGLETLVAARTTELEAQRGELRRAVETLRAVMGALPDGVLAITDDRIVFANEAAARILGRAAEELPGAALADQLPAERLRTLVAEVLATSNPVGPIELRIAPDPERPVDLEIDALATELVGRRTVLVILHDVSERTRMREQLLRSDRLASLGTLVAGIAHEINNPLSYVLSNVETARDLVGQQPASPERIELGAMLADAVDGSQRIRTIVSGMRSFARPEVAEVGDLDLRDVVGDALKLTRHTIDHQAGLAVELDPVPLTHGNRARLGQVAVNLMMNALQAPRRPGDGREIRVSTRVGANGEVRLEVRDNGLGMSRDVLARAFDPFFTTKPVGAGTGLGLSICHGIATAYGGKIELSSIEGEGTVASLVMPATGPVPIPAVAAPERAATSTRVARVLIVDDEPLLARAMQRMLKGHHVEVAGTVAEVESRLKSGPFDLVLCDLMMPGVTGMELYARLSRDAPEIATRMTFMTGGAFTPEALAFVEKMQDRCVIKPISMATLSRLVEAALLSER